MKTFLNRVWSHFPGEERCVPSFKLSIRRLLVWLMCVLIIISNMLSILSVFVYFLSWFQVSWGSLFLISSGTETERRSLFFLLNMLSMKENQQKTDTEKCIFASGHGDKDVFELWTKCEYREKVWSPTFKRGQEVLLGVKKVNILQVMSFNLIQNHLLMWFWIHLFLKSDLHQSRSDQDRSSKRQKLNISASLSKLYWACSVSHMTRK